MYLQMFACISFRGDLSHPRLVLGKRMQADYVGYYIISHFINEIISIFNQRWISSLKLSLKNQMGVTVGGTKIGSEETGKILMRKRSFLIRLLIW